MNKTTLIISALYAIALGAFVIDSFYFFGPLNAATVGSTLLGMLIGLASRKKRFGEPEASVRSS